MGLAISSTRLLDRKQGSDAMHEKRNSRSKREKAVTGPGGFVKGLEGER